MPDGPPATFTFLLGSNKHALFYTHRCDKCGSLVGPDVDHNMLCWCCAFKPGGTSYTKLDEPQANREMG